MNKVGMVDYPYLFIDFRKHMVHIRVLVITEKNNAIRVSDDYLFYNVSFVAFVFRSSFKVASFYIVSSATVDPKARVKMA